jgi:Cation/multidrug efflux pump
MIRYGRNFSGTGQNLGQGFIALKHWDERSGQHNSAQAIRERAMKHFKKFNNAQINVSMPSSVSGLGQTDGLEFWLRDMNGEGVLISMRNLKACKRNPHNTVVSKI